MASQFNFVADTVTAGKAYPALAQWQAQPYTQEWRQFSQHWPYTVPCDLHEHCVAHNFDHAISTVDHCHGSGYFYTIGLGFFDFGIDYFSLIPPAVIRQGITILFYYHEGDNPDRIRQRLDDLCCQHGLDPGCYRFVSGNTAADNIPGFAWFPDHELLYWHRNRAVPATAIHWDHRPYRFTVLNRTHKWWRATVMADLERHGVLAVSQWSYNTNVIADDDAADNPIEIDTLGLRDAVERFVAQGPYRCDELTADEHNNHHLHVPEHYTYSYCHIVIETHFDADQSSGAFLTEKTFKPIKHGQPFVIVGCAGTLQALRDLGYRTFDQVIDNSYDRETNNTRRWQLVRNAILDIQRQDPVAWLQKCAEDMAHNQAHFLASKHHRLNNLYDKLLHQLATT